MSQTTRRATGRPKAQPEAVKEAAPETAVMEAPKAPAAKKRSIKRKETVLYHAEYEIPKNAGIVYMLPQKGITVYDSDLDNRT